MNRLGREPILKGFHIIGFILVMNWSFAQTYPVKFGHIGSRDGLSQVTVYHIHKDYLGFLWLGTSEGLNKYDGTDITVYLPILEDSTSISSGFIKKIIEDEAHNLWITTANGLNRLDRKNDRFSRFLVKEDNSENGLPSHLTDMVQDENGNLWIGTLEGGIYQMNEHTQIPTYYPPPPSYEDINCLLIDSQSQLWTAFQTGQVAIFDKKTKRFNEIKELSDTVEIRSLYEDTKGNFWVGTDRSGLKLWDKKTKTTKHFLNDVNNPNSINNNVIWSITEDSRGNLMLGTEAGVNFLNLHTFSVEQPYFWNTQQDPINTYGLSANFVRYIFHDEDTNITWFGNTETGVDYWDRRTQQFIHYHAMGSRNEEGSTNILSNKVVWSICGNDDQYIWCGTSNGLNQINRTTGQVKFYYHEPDNIKNSLGSGRIWSIIDGGNNTFWIGTSDTKGITKLSVGSDGKPTFRTYLGASSNSIRSLHKDQYGYIWVGTNVGLNKFDERSEEFQSYFANLHDPNAISDNYIRAILQDSKARLWIGTSGGGLNLFDYQKETFKVFQHDHRDSTSICNSQIRALYEDKKGQLWIGTSGGLSKMVEHKGQIQFKNYSIENGLPNNIIYAVQGDKKDRIWFSSNKGISCLNPSTNSISNFSIEDGLQDMEFNSNASFKSKQGELFFGGVNGFNFLQPENISIHDTASSKVILTEFRLNNRHVPVTSNGRLKENINEAKRIDLNRNDKVFSFRFAALDLGQRIANRYAYKLEGWDEDWNYVEQQNLAFYTNIPYGNYTFKVKTATKNGSWDTEVTSIQVVIPPAFWQTAPFWASMVLFFIGCILLYVRIRTRALNQQKMLLEDTVKERTEELNRRNQDLETALTDLKKTQTKLIQSERLASLGQLTAGIAHEINNPINFVASNVQALKMDFEDIQQLLFKVTELKECDESKICLNELMQISDRIDTEYLSKEVNELIGGIERGAKRTQNIVTSLRAFSRDTKNDFVEADIQENLDSTLTILNSQIRDRITIHKNYGNIPNIKCQIGKLNQVFLNIIVNSIQAIEGEGAISIATLKENQHLIIEIKDTGKGMDAATQKQIFEPFFTTKEVGDGTGLGLAISYGIIEEHQGSIEVESEVGKGSIFRIQLPI